MIRSKMVFAVWMALVALSGMARAGVINGSFENGAPQPDAGMFRNLAVGDGSITGWTPIVSDIDWGNNGFASDGTHAIDLNGHDGPGGIRQVLSTVPGQVVNLLFDMNANTLVSDPSVRTLTVSAAGFSQSYTYDPTQEPGRPWVTFAFSFVASGVSTPLDIVSTSADQYLGPAVDNVRVAVAEPSSLVLAATMVPLGLLMRRRARRGRI